MQRNDAYHWWITWLLLLWLGGVCFTLQVEYMEASLKPVTGSLLLIAGSDRRQTCQYANTQVTLSHLKWKPLKRHCESWTVLENHRSIGVGKPGSSRYKAVSKIWEKSRFTRKVRMSTWPLCCHCPMLENCTPFSSRCRRPCPGHPASLSSS